MKESILKTKSYLFALEIVKICRALSVVEKEFVLSRQLLKSGTSIGALIREAEHAQSVADFISKMSIALKEANETEYWIMLLRDSGLLDTLIANPLIISNNELISMLVSTIKTSKKQTGHWPILNFQFSTLSSQLSTYNINLNRNYYN